MWMDSTNIHDDEVLPGLGYLTAGLTAALSKLAEEKFASHKIAPVEYAILDTCAGGQVDTVMGLARVIPMDKASISRRVATLVARGLIRRIRLEEDRRVVRLELTDEGLALARQLRESIREANPMVSMGLGDEEKRVFLEVMRKIWENLIGEGYGGEGGTRSMPQGRLQHLPPVLGSRDQRGSPPTSGPGLTL